LISRWRARLPLIALAAQRPLYVAEYFGWRKQTSRTRIAQRSMDLSQSTYSGSAPRLGPPLSNFAPTAERIGQAWIDCSENYIRHRFDILGSGWMKIAHGSEPCGLEGEKLPPGPAVKADIDGAWIESRVNSANAAASRAIWKMIGGNYEPIDWQLDIKSGYRWKESEWFADGGVTPNVRGADVKLPWELSRCHPLTVLSFAYAKDRDERWVREMRAQILDFIAQNPPRFGANWKCAMDVGIRAANWIVALDLFLALGAKFDAEFLAVFARSLRDHALYIVTNLEWSPLVRANHYLADVAGLLFIAARLESTEETDSWLSFAAREVLFETSVQFQRDGSSFESSTSYHRLSAEMVAHAVAVIGGPARLRLASAASKPTGAWKPDRFPSLAPRDTSVDFANAQPAWLFERLERMAEFTSHVTKGNGRIAQIGDNDSGRFLKLDAVLIGTQEPREEFLVHGDLISTINGFFGRRDLERKARSAGIGRAWIESMTGGIRVSSYRSAERSDRPEEVRVSEADWEDLERLYSTVPREFRRELVLPLPMDIDMDQVEHVGYPDFGVYGFRAKRFTLLVRCGRFGKDGTGAHAHNDQLSCELEIDGVDCIVDPGSYLYTPRPDHRNLYRSTKAHFTPVVAGDREQGDLNQGLFYLNDRARGTCLVFEERRFAGRHDGFGEPVIRLIDIGAKGVRIRDFSETEPISWPPYEISNGRLRLKIVEFSDGYGRKGERSSA
jgi:hypothetical protein